MGFMGFLKANVTMGFVVLTITTLYRMALIIIMISYSVIHTNRYTYWNYVGQTLFYVLLWISYMWKRTYLRNVLNIFVLPIVIGSVVLVFAYIIVVLQLDGGKLLMDATTFGGGSLTLGSVHTFDHIIHTLIVIDMMIILVSGYIQDARHSVMAFYGAIRKTRDRVFFHLYFFLVPMLPFALYGCFFNPFREYPTPGPDAIPLIFGLIVYLLIVWWTSIVLTTKTYGQFS